MPASADTSVTTTPRRQRLTPAERRAQILDAAQGLFFDRGWDAVTIADVLAEAGLSKGGFYHHFTAKEDLLDGVIGRFTHEALAAAGAARDATGGDALTRFNAFLAETTRWKTEQAPQIRFLVDAMLRPGNDMLFHRIAEASNGAAGPVLRLMIAEGAAEGLFDVPDIDIVLEAVLGVGERRRGPMIAALAAARAGDIDGAADMLTARMTAEGALMDRLLGLPPGSIALANRSEYRAMLCAMVSD